MILFSDAMYKILKKEGFAGLWSGTIPSIVLAINPAIQFMVYEALKRKFQETFHAKVCQQVLTNFHCLHSVWKSSLVVKTSSFKTKTGPFKTKTSAGKTETKTRKITSPH